VRVVFSLVWVLTFVALGGGQAWAQFEPTSDPLAGSTFQGADGNQDDAAGLIDWQALQAAGRVGHATDPNDEDSVFEGGTKETEPGAWEFGTERGGLTPGKDNVRDAWAGFQLLSGDMFLYLGFTRESPNGDTFLTFELNRSARRWNNGRAFISCRRTGDLLISYEAHGNDINVVPHRWRTTSYDPRTGCARTGTLTEITGLRENVDAQGAMNGADVASRLPGEIAGTVPERRFGEAALNLSLILRRATGDDCMAFSSITMHSRSSESISSQMKDVLGPAPLPLRTCAASGVKFFDSDADGVRDAGERGIPGFVIWADYDDDGVRDRGEPFSISDRSGRYVIFDIKPPDGTYTLRERLLPRRRRQAPLRTNWICSYPNASTPGGSGNAPDGRFPCGWGPIDSESTPDAEGHDFGNWFPARLTVEKELFPASDAGRFDLLVNGQVVVAAAGDGATRTISVPPGVYSVAERPAGATDGAAYRTIADCKTNASTPPRIAPNPAALTLTAGREASCKFINVRIGAVGLPTPAIAIRKFGTPVARAGGMLRYALVVTNPGFLPVAEAAVTVTDPGCDAPPRLRSKSGDATPGTLNPGDRWIYGCTRSTSSAGDDCVPTTVPNMGLVTGSAGGTSVRDDDSSSTLLLCPVQPLQVLPAPIDPTGPARPLDPSQPGPVAPVLPAPPPTAGDAALSSLSLPRPARAARGCIDTRLPRVNLSGTRIEQIRVSVNGRRVRTLNLRTLQRRTRPRIMLAPGRYRVRARVVFEPGSGTPPVTLARTVRVCTPRATAPRFTG
jgi:hypothetical protein